MRADFFKFFLLLFPLIGVMATVQHMLVMELAFTPRFYIVPLIVSLAIGFLAAKVRDLTRKAEAQRWESALAESQRLRTLGLFASSIANDLGTMMQGVRLGIETRDAVQDAEAYEQIMLKSLKHGEEMVGQLMSLAHGDASVERLDLIKLLTKVQETASQLSEGRAELVCHWGTEKDLYVMGSRSQLQQVFLNIVVNSLQATLESKDASIAILVDAADALVRVSIEDNGPGVPEDLRSHLFLPPAAPLDNTRLGVGLYVCNQIVEAHGGRITYSDAEQGGARLLVSLPLV